MSNHDTLLKVKTKKYMLSLLLGTHQCEECARWFTHEATLRQHLQMVHALGPGTNQVYPNLLMANVGLKSKMRPTCVLCHDQKVTF